MTTVTFDQLKQWVPELGLLERDIRHTAEARKSRRVVCANALWYGYGDELSRDFRTFKNNLVPTVGWMRKGARAPHPDPAVEQILRSSEAYDVAYDHLYSLLPDCRGCGCM